MRDVLTTFLLAAVVYLGLRATMQDYIIRQSSMEPSFQEGQRVLVNKVVYRLHAPERGDVIILRPPQARSSQAVPFIKRIVALPGESVDIKGGAVYVNGVKLDEPYIKESPVYTYSLDQVPDNEYFVLGDNRNNTDDSHRGWTVPRRDVIGKAWMTIWPPDRWGLVSSYDLSEQVKVRTNLVPYRDTGMVLQK
ncbi:MAG: signal peptidase I [Chloroflexi bacterium]|nr:signal peptidase I [Chloroflexota bacterium]